MHNSINSVQKLNATRGDRVSIPNWNIQNKMKKKINGRSEKNKYKRVWAWGTEQNTICTSKEKRKKKISVTNSNVMSNFQQTIEREREKNKKKHFSPVPIIYSNKQGNLIS